MTVFISVNSKIYEIHISQYQFLESLQLEMQNYVNNNKFNTPSYLYVKNIFAFYLRNHLLNKKTSILNDNTIAHYYTK